MLESELESGSTGLLEIGAVARELGVAPSTLRTWERRYHLVVPHRGSRGQRLYDYDQMVMLRRILGLVRRGTRASAAHDLAHAPGPIRISRIRIPPSPEAPRRARRAIDDLVRDFGEPRFAFHLRLVASELVKNAFLYGSARDPIRMETRLYADRAELGVSNGGAPLSLRSLRARRRGGGRGLDIVDALADAWSIAAGPPGTRITIRLTVDR